MSHNSLRGAEAKSISIALGLDKSSNGQDTEYKVEISFYKFFNQISAQTRQSYIEVNVFKDKSVDVLEVDMGAEKANRTMFDSKDSSVTILTAAWSSESTGDFTEMESIGSQKDVVASEWAKYTAILAEAKQLASLQTILQAEHC